MIASNTSEAFILTVTLLDDIFNSNISGQNITYDIRKQPDDISLIPPIQGILEESTIVAGVYKKEIVIDYPGTYVAYITCSGFSSDAEEIIIKNDYNKQYNISVEDVPRVSEIPTTSQINRRVGLGKTDYIITKLKPDNSSTWDHPNTISGITFAHYRDYEDDTPYLMGDSGE